MKIKFVQLNKGFTFFSLEKKARLLLKSILLKTKYNSGFTLIEVLIYTTILAVASFVIIAFVMQVLGVNDSTRRTRESLDNARRSLDMIAQEIRHARGVYDPTSTFGTSSGQLSLETTRDLPADENSTYVDFYLDNEALYMKREGQSTQLLTSEKVKVTNLTFTNLNGSTSRPSIRISITVEYKAATTGPKNSVTMVSTAVLRNQ